MNYLELQIRVNKIVEQVNNYEATLPEDVKDEQELIALHKFVDTDSLKAVVQYIIDNYYEASIPVKSQQKFFYFNLWQPFYSDYGTRFLQYIGNSLSSDITSSNTYTEYKNVLNKNIVCNVDLLSNSGSPSDFIALANLGYGYTSGNKILSSSFKQSLGFQSYEGGYLDDVLITEGQVQNLNNFQLFSSLSNTDYIIRSCGQRNSGLILLTSDKESSNSFPFIINPNYFPSFSSTNNNEKCCYGKTLTANNTDNSSKLDYDVSGHGSNRFKYIAPMNCVKAGVYGQTSYSQYSQKAPISAQTFNTGDEYIDSSGSTFYVTHGANSAYFELCFKRRRPGCKALGLDFVPSISSIEDNDPQGLAARLALAQTKPYFDQMDVWWNELTPYYTADGYYQRRLADKIYEETKNMTDKEFIKNYKMNYETYAYATGDEL